MKNRENQPAKRGALGNVALLIFLLAFAQAKAEGPSVPPNAPAQVKVDATKLEVVYNGQTIFSGRVENAAHPDGMVANAFKIGEAVHQVIALNGKTSGKPVVLSGLIRGSE